MSTSADFDGVVVAAPAWVEVPQLSVPCIVKGGAGGSMNAQAVALTARTNYLAEQLASVVAGNGLHSGTGAPDDDLGTNGDFYIDTAATTLYGPKAADAWPAGVSLVGPSGSAGSGGFTTAVRFATAGTFSWTVPAGVTQLMLEAWGAGQGGGKKSGTAVKGGDGGSYAKAMMTVTPGEVLTINVGAGGDGAPYPGADTNTGSSGGRTYVGNVSTAKMLSQPSIGQNDFQVNGACTLVHAVAGEKMPGLVNNERGGGAPFGAFGAMWLVSPAPSPGGGGYGSSSGTAQGGAGGVGQVLIWY